ncbi:MAG: flavocytochrome c [Peptostreptococcaceae bacterium]
MILKDGIYEGIAKGYGGEIKLEIKIYNSKIENIEIISHMETKIISDPAFKYVPENIVKANSICVPNISGCSITSRALKEAVKDALIKSGADKSLLEQLIIESETLDKISSNNRIRLKDNEKTDVIVVGSGGAGLSAAISSASFGKKVIVVEKMNKLGGNTLVSMGGVNVPKNDAQIKKGIDDNKEDFYEDIIIGGDNESNKEQAKILCENAYDTYRWLQDYVGVKFKDSLIHFGGHRVSRAAVFEGKYAIELITKLREKAIKLGVKIVSGVDCRELIVENDRVCGIKVLANGDTLEILSNYGVILATGGFSGNVDMRKKYDSSLDERYKTTNVSGVSGDGHIMCEKVDAKFVHMNYIQSFPIANPNTGELSHVGGSRFDGAVLVNKKGNRFVEELERRDVVSEAILNQDTSYLIWGNEVESINFGVKENLSEVNRLKKDDLFIEVNSLEEGAKYFGIDEGNLIKSIDRYNKFVENKKDEDFNRRGNLVKIEKAPFYFQVVAPAVHHTMGGVVINDKNEVQNNNNESIKGLFAAGEIVGGTHGTNRLGGNAITEILVFGKRAGENIGRCD